VDSTLLCPISAIASQSANPTEKTLELTNHLLDDLGTQEEVILTYNPSKMVLAAHRNASYLSKQRHKAERDHTSSFLATAPSHKTTVPSLT
jgi:hypothetical protein